MKLRRTMNRRQDKVGRFRIQNTNLLPKQARVRKQKALLHKSSLLSPMGSIATGSIPSVDRSPDDMMSPQLMAMLKAKKQILKSDLESRTRSNWQEYEERK